MNLPKLLLTALVSIVLSTYSIKAQDLPNDLTAISQTDVPVFATYFSIAYWPDYPPLPFNGWDSGGTLYYSPTYGTSYIWVDDRALVAGRMFTSDTDDPPPIPDGGDGGGSDPGPDPMPQVDYGTNLWIQILNVTNQLSDAGTQRVANLFLRNTTAGVAYEIISSVNPSAPMSNWVSEGIWLAPGTNTPTPVPVWDRTTELCFRGKIWDGTFSHGAATNGQIYLLCQDTNQIHGVINGVTNAITPIYSNWVVLQPPVWTANFGFSGEDTGPSNYFSLFDQQNLHAMLGFSRSISNFALSFNALTNIDVHGWPNLTYLEMFHPTNLLAVSVTNCPKLYRVCFEGVDGLTLTNGIKDVIDLTGCTNLADFRAANNNITNVILGPNGGSNIWHFCTRDARGRGGVYPIIQGTPFKSLPSLKQLWVFRDQSFVDNIVITVTNAPQLESVEAQGNFFQSLTVSGQTNLDHVFAESNPGMTNLVITGCSVLKKVRASFDSLPTPVIDAILIALDQTGISTNATDTSLDVELAGGSNGSPSPDGMRSKFNLQAKHWLVLNNAPPAGTPSISGLSFSHTATSATITWTTDVSSDSTVYYSTDTSFGSSSNVAALTTSHSVTLLGLTPNTTYNYYVHSTSGTLTGTSGNNQFATANSKAIWFTNSSTTVAMQVSAVSGATVNWYWGDGTNDTGTTASHTFVNAGSYSNAVVVDPASALLGFGVSCGNTYSVSNTLLRSVSGLTNYPNLGSLYLLSTYLADLSLIGCSNLTHLALIHTAPSTNTENAWFHDLATAQVAGKPSCTVTPVCDGSTYCDYFFCPATPGPTNTASGSDYWKLQQSPLNWHIVPLD